MNTTIKTSICGLLALLTVLIFPNISHAQTYSNYNNSMYIKGNAKVRDSLLVPGGFAVIGADTITPGAAFEVNSTDGGVLISRMDETQRDAIATPPTGLMIFNTTSGRFELYNGTEWKALLIAGDVTGGSGSGAIWGDTIEGSPNHGYQVPYFSPSGKLISDSEFIRDSVNHSMIIEADTQMILLNNDAWGAPTTGFYRPAYGFTSLAGFMDLTSFGSDSCQLWLGFMDPITFDNHGYFAKIADSTLEIESLKNIDIEAENYLQSNATVFDVAVKSNFDIKTQDDSDYAFGVSGFGNDAECCQNSVGLFKTYKPYDMSVNSFRIGDWGMEMKHIFNESSFSDYSESSIQINDSRILIQANDSTFGDPAAYIRLNDFGTIEFGYGFQYYTFPTYTGGPGQVLTTDGINSLYWSDMSSGDGSGAETLKDTSITIISDSILVCNTRPQELLPASGPGYYYDIISVISKINFNTTAYSTDTGLMIICEGADANMFQNVNLLTSTTSRIIKGWSYITPFSVSDNQIIENSRLLLTTMMNDPTDGDSDITLNIIYRKVFF